MYTVAFTGHRPPRLGGYDRPDGTVPELRRQLRAMIQTELAATAADHPEGLRVVVGGALGVDTDAAIIAHYLELPFVVAVPCRGQDSRWPQASRDLYARMLEAAEEVVLVSDEPYSADAMHRRNAWMVDRCDELFAVYDGVSQGGTSSCMRYAERTGRLVRRIWV